MYQATSFNNSEDSDDHGIYVSSATVDSVIVGNEIQGSRGAGLHMNGDLSQGGDGLITGARIEGNVIYGNGEKGGSAINCDGVQNSLIRNNLLYDNHASGISLYRVDAAEGARNNVVAAPSSLPGRPTRLPQRPCTTGARRPTGRSDRIQAWSSGTLSP